MVVLIYILLMLIDVEHHFVCLFAIFMSSLMSITVFLTFFRLECLFSILLNFEGCCFIERGKPQKNHAEKLLKLPQGWVFTCLNCFHLYLVMNHFFP